MLFVSHSSRDRQAVGRMVAGLEQRGFECWLSSRDIQPGDDYQESIAAAISDCQAVLLLLSEHANQSREVAKEDGDCLPLGGGASCQYG